MLNIAFDATPDMHFYAKYSTGFPPAAPSRPLAELQRVRSGSVKSYGDRREDGLLRPSARPELAGYIMDRSNTQFDVDLYDTSATSPTNGSHIEQTQNAGKTKIRGIEADLTVKPTAGLTLSASYAYTYWKAPSAVNPITGGLPQQLYIVYTPKNAASGAIDYVLPVNIAGGANAPAPSTATMRAASTASSSSRPRPTRAS